MQHGFEERLIRGEGVVGGDIFQQAKDPLKTKPDPSKPTKRREFCRLFEKGEQADPDSLERLGGVMETEGDNPSPERDSQVPAGYTYLGQFLDHDITFDRTSVLSRDGTADPNALANARSPALDLDSVYGGGPAKSPHLYEADEKTLKVGRTTPVDGIADLRNDLFREETVAQIGDPRNDENLAVAQTHLAFVKFHNVMADKMSGASFDDVRREVVRHYQAIVLGDFLPRVVDNAVLADVMANGRRFYGDDLAECMPIEFSVAAYRMGHSMIRPSYEWNRIFNSAGPRGIATFTQLFEFSGVSGTRGAGDPPFQGLPTLPSNWIVDWRRLYDIPGHQHPQLNRARKTDAVMSFALKNLPEFQQMDPPPPEAMLSLAIRNLLRGRLFSLPSGQAVADAIGVAPLSPTELTDGAANGQAAILRDTGFDEVTPLWYYILREAMVQNGGERLGQVGSRIVAETIVGLIEHSPVNVREGDPLAFTMPDLLLAVGDLNPIGD